MSPVSMRLLHRGEWAILGWGALCLLLLLVPMQALWTGDSLPLGSLVAGLMLAVAATTALAMQGWIRMACTVGALLTRRRHLADQGAALRFVEGCAIAANIPMPQEVRLLVYPHRDGASCLAWAGPLVLDRDQTQACTHLYTQGAGMVAVGSGMQMRTLARVELDTRRYSAHERLSRAQEAAAATAHARARALPPLRALTRAMARVFPTT